VATDTLFPSLDEQLRAYSQGELDRLDLLAWVSEQVWDASAPTGRLGHAFLVLSEAIDGVRSDASLRMEIARLIPPPLAEPVGANRTRSSAIIQGPEPLKLAA
jgi:hypothetical protein